MFNIFLLQTNYSGYEIATQQSLDFDVYQLFNDVEIGSSIEPLKVLQKTLKKQHEEMIRLELAIPQTDDIKENVQLLMQRCEALKVSYGIIM